MDSHLDRGAGEVTQLLQSVSLGHRDALDRLISLLYDELRQMAERQLGREHMPRTLSATGLVHEAYFKLASNSVNALHRTHFLGVAAHAMRQVLVDQARRRAAVKRGGEFMQTTLSHGADAIDVKAEELLALDDALEKLTPRQREIVEYRFFAGLEEREIAELLGVSDRTVRREWVKARAWLYRELYVT